LNERSEPTLPVDVIVEIKGDLLVLFTESGLIDSLDGVPEE